MKVLFLAYANSVKDKMPNLEILTGSEDKTAKLWEAVVY